jgi:hypothetical protein
MHGTYEPRLMDNFDEKNLRRCKKLPTPFGTKFASSH